MKEITIYEASDGSRFNSAIDCRRYEALCVDVAEAMAELRPIPDTCEFQNGKGFVQQSKKQIDFAIDKIAKAALRFFPKGGTCEEWFTQWMDGKRHISHVARLVSDSGEVCLYRATTRLMCIDDKLREWGQPYYAMNPGTGIDMEVSVAS